MSSALEYAALLFAVIAGFGYANHYLLKLPHNSGLLVIALASSLSLRVIEYAFPSVEFAAVLLLSRRNSVSTSSRLRLGPG
jgi:hypothetical protein